MTKSSLAFLICNVWPVFTLAPNHCPTARTNSHSQYHGNAHFRLPCHASRSAPFRPDKCSHKPRVQPTKGGLHKNHCLCANTSVRVCRQNCQIFTFTVVVDSRPRFERNPAQQPATAATRSTCLRCLLTVTQCSATAPTEPLQLSSAPTHRQSRQVRTICVYTLSTTAQYNHHMLNLLQECASADNNEGNIHTAYAHAEKISLNTQTQTERGGSRILNRKMPRLCSSGAHCLFCAHTSAQRVAGGEHADASHSTPTVALERCAACISVAGVSRVRAPHGTRFMMYE